VRLGARGVSSPAQNTRRPRGFGFVVFEDAAVVQTLLGAHSIAGKAVEVKRATPRAALAPAPRRSRGGGRGGRGGAQAGPEGPEAVGGAYPAYPGFMLAPGFFPPQHYPPGAGGPGPGFAGFGRDQQLAFQGQQMHMMGQMGQMGHMGQGFVPPNYAPAYYGGGPQYPQVIAAGQPAGPPGAPQPTLSGAGA